MKIDRIYVIGNRKDLYFTRICIASIRYWNKEIAVSLIKDHSNGDYDTTELEQAMNVSVPGLPFKNLSYYSKLYPFIEQATSERIMILDSDIVWMCDMVALLESYAEDFIVDGYNPADLEAEMKRWYFKLPAFTKQYPGYQYPGFLFNVGQMLCNTSAFSREDFSAILLWKENPSAIKDVFFYEQGMLNWLLAEKLKQNSITVRQVNFHRWGWDKTLGTVTPAMIATKQPNPFLIHWYGEKNGLTSFLPCSEVLKFYEASYFSSIPNGNFRMLTERLQRSLKHLPSLVYESAKWVFYLFKKDNR